MSSTIPPFELVETVTIDGNLLVDENERVRETEMVRAQDESW